MIKGKGIYAWVLERCEDGDMAAVVSRLKQAGMTHVIPKFADGVWSYARNEAYLKNLITFAHREGIQVIPFHFVFGQQPTHEAQRAITELRKYPFDGLVINAEGAYKQVANPSQAARLYCDALRSKFPDLPLALSTYRFPTLHREFPFATFLNYCDYNMPQIYWMQSNGTVPAQVERTLKEYKAFPNKPMIPTGAAFSEHGWTAIPNDQRIFIEQVKKHNLPGCNWWEYWHAFNRFPELGEMIANTPFEVGELPPISPEPEPPAGTFWAVCTATYGLTVRAEPKIANNIVGYLSNGDKRLVYEQSGIWWRIGDNAWVSSNFMQRTTDTVAPEPPTLTLEGRVTRIEQHLGL